MRKGWIFLAVFLGLLVAIRIALPYVIEWQANEQLANLPEYRGHVEDVDLAIWRGAFSLEGLDVRSKAGDLALSVPDVEMNLSWSHLFRRMLVFDLLIDHPRVRMRMTPAGKKAAKEAAEEPKKETGQSLPDLLRGLVPFQLDDFWIRDGSIAVSQIGADRPMSEADQKKEKQEERESGEKPDAEPGMRALVSDLDVHVANLTNTRREEGTTMARGEARAKLNETGVFQMNLKLNPLTRQPTFDVDMTVRDFALTSVNPLLRERLGVDIDKGDFDMSMEAAAKDGSFEGYVRPVLRNLELVNLKKDKGAVEVVKSAIAGAAASVFTNPRADQVATRIPFSGQFENPDIGIWQAIANVLRNAFVEALRPTLERSVNLGEVGKDKKER